MSHTFSRHTLRSTLVQRQIKRFDYSGDVPCHPHRSKEGRWLYILLSLFWNVLALVWLLYQNQVAFRIFYSLSTMFCLSPDMSLLSRRKDKKEGQKYRQKYRNDKPHLSVWLYNTNVIYNCRLTYVLKKSTVGVKVLDIWSISCVPLCESEEVRGKGM